MVHPRWNCSRSILCWFHFSRLSLSSLLPPTKLRPLSHLSWTTLPQRFMNLLKHIMKSSMSTEWTNSRWIARVFGHANRQHQHFTVLPPSLTYKGQKGPFRRRKREADKPSCDLSEKVPFAVSLAWLEIPCRQCIGWQQSKLPSLSKELRCKRFFSILDSAQTDTNCY